QPLQAAKRARSQEQSVSSIISDVVRLFSADISDARVQVLIPQDQDFILECARSELLQIFMNLVDNAIYWLRTVEDRRLEIQIRGKEREVVIRDSGPGIKPEIAEMIFEPFYTTKDNGRGLGLYIVQDVMARRGWTVNLIPSDAH